MTDYKSLKARLDLGDVLLLDGAIGTQIQEMGAPMDNAAWAAAALHTHPNTVRRMHELYIQAGCDVITTNTYSSARHNIEPLGLGDSTYELNLRAVALAQDARDRAARDRPVWIGGSISNFGILVGGEPKKALHRHARQRQSITAEQARANLVEQAEILAESGVDFLMVESTGSMEHRKWILDACRSTGLPVWTGFRCRVDRGDPVVKVGYSVETPFADGLAEVDRIGTDAIAIFHSLIDDTTAAIKIAREQFGGPLVVYPEADRTDYTATYKNEGEETKITPADYAALARRWVDMGVQVIGGCCGIGLPFIRPLRDALPAKAGGKATASTAALRQRQ
jgi:S-methylmethionine-dependent homocysteine/selenocysteine methylase